MSLSDSDVQRIVAEIIKQTNSQKEGDEDGEEKENPCRFEGISPEELKEVVKFIRNVNGAMSDTKKIIRRAIILFLLSSMGIVLGLGIVAKAKTLLGIDP